MIKINWGNRHPEKVTFALTKALRTGHFVSHLSGFSYQVHEGKKPAGRFV